MKKSVLLSAIFAVVMFFGNVNAQVNLEYIFDGAVFPISDNFEFVGNLNFLDFRGYVNHYDTKSIKVYKEDYSLKCVISAPVGFDGYAACISEKVFNTDSKIEYLSYFTDGTNNGDEYLRLYNEDGDLIKDFGITLNAVIFATSKQEYKLMILKGDYDTDDYTTEIYSLPGKANEVALLKSNERKTTDLAFNLRPGEVATLKVYNIKGQLIETKKVDYVFNRLLLNTTNYRKGVYVYEINGISKKFRVK